MKLKKIESSTAIGVGLLFALFSFVATLIQVVYIVIRSSGDTSLLNAASLVPALIETPLVLGVTGSFATWIIILIYNKVAKKYPIAWEFSK
tara:strand:- start:360 stop:632 length:273 start_codon:yes stop_codon:yes gene_type:complete